MKQWLGVVPKVCDLCHRTLGTVFVDGKTKSGPWGIMCPSCHKYHGYGLGVGKGQKYRKTKVEGETKWLKIEK